MGILTRPKLYAQQRVDLEDFEVLFEAIRTDSKMNIKQFWSPGQYIMKGFNVSGLGGANTATINLTDATLVNASNTMCFSWWSAEDGVAPITVDLNPNVKNYLEIELVDQTGTPLTRAFWDQALLNGEGGEFNETVDTVEEVNVNVVALTGGFSGSPDRIQLAIVETNLANQVLGIVDQRELFWRLGTLLDPQADYNWSTREEPGLQCNISGATGTFTVGETVTFTGGATGEVKADNGTNIVVILLSSTGFAATDTITGGTSGETATMDSFISEFSGADKDITNLKEMFDALWTEIKLLKGTRFSFELANMSMNGLASFWNSNVVQISTQDPAFTWTGTALEITDTEGAPTDADVIARFKRFGKSGNLDLTRQDATSVSIPIADQEVLFIKMPATDIDRAYSGVGAADTNYQTVAVADFDISDDNLWLAYRESGKLYIRGHGELESGQSVQPGDPISAQILAYMGASDESDSTPDYTNATGPAIPNNNVIDGESLTTGIKRNDIAIGGFSSSSIQDKNKSLIEGANWAWDMDADTLSWSANAFFSIPGVDKLRNQIDAGFVALAADQDVAYVTVNRAAGAPASLTVSTGAMSAVVLGADDYIFARRIGNYVLVDESMILGPDEILTLDGWLQEINRYFGQFQITPKDLSPERVKISGSLISKLNGSSLTQTIDQKLLEFAGGEIDFAAGNIYDASGTIVVGTFTPITLGAAEYGWYSLQINPGTVASNNVFPGEIEVIPADSSNAVLANANRADFGTDGLAIGEVYVQEDGGGGLEAVLFENISQLGVGSGGGSGGSVKVVIDAVEALTTTTIVFNESWTSDKTNIKFYRNGIKMIRVDAFSTFPGPTGKESFAQEYMEVGSGDINSIELHPNFEAGIVDPLVSELFELCHTQNTFDGFGLAEKFYQSARVNGNGTGNINATAAPVALKTRVTLTSFSYNPLQNLGGWRGDLLVLVNGQEIERLVAGKNDDDENVIYEEDPISGAYVDIYKITGGTTEVIPDESTIQIFKIQYRVLEMDALAADLIPATDATYVLGSAGNKWLALSVSEIRSDLIPDIDNARDLGTALKRWRDIYLGPGSIKMLDAGANLFEMKMEGGRGGFKQPGEAFKEFGSVDDEAILGADDTQSYIKEVLVDAQDSDIVDRSQVLDDANTLRVLPPIERMLFNELVRLPKESGPSGEIIYSAVRGDTKIRFSKNWQYRAGESGGTGVRILNTAASWTDPNSFFEIRYYGTGLNILGASRTTTTCIADVEIEGVGGPTVDLAFSLHSIQSGRNIQTMECVNVVKNQTLGWHTVLLRGRGGNGTTPVLYGIEILNEGSELTITPGKAFSGLTPFTFATATNLPYSPTAYTGNKGARVQVYIDPTDGVMKQAFNEPAGTPLYIGASDFSNSEQIQEGGLNFQEFGANFSEDFSTTGTKNRSFFLRDNTTFLKGEGSTRDLVTTTGINSIFNDSMGNTITIGFIGTGLKVRVAGQSTGSYDLDNVNIDGVAQGSIIGSPNQEYIDVCSDLDFDYHTISFTRNTTVQHAVHYVDFIPYQPAAPSTPAGAIILADYCVPADFADNTATTTENTSRGTIRKGPFRDWIYDGVGFFTSLSPQDRFTGNAILSGGVGDIAKIKFYGTGFQFKWVADVNRASNVQMRVNGGTDTSSYTTSHFGQGSFTPGTGVINQNGAGSEVASGISVTDMPLDWYEVEFENVSGNFLFIDAFDIITPIVQIDPTFKANVSSCKDSRNFSFIKDIPKKVDMTKAKGLLRFDQNSNTIKSSLNIASIIDEGVGENLIYLETPVRNMVLMAGGNAVLTSNPHCVEATIVSDSIIQLRVQNNDFTTSGVYEDNEYSLIIFGELDGEGED